MTFRVLSANEATERAQWLAAWQRSAEREPFAHPSYVALFAKDGDEPLCALWEAEGGALLYPLLRRPLALQDWAAKASGSDLTSPYGYGGPFAEGSCVGSAAEFWQAFDAWATEHAVTASFTRLSLFENQLPVLPEPAQDLFPNVVRCLELSEDDLWKDYAHKVRKNVNRARKNELSVEVDPQGTRLPEFLAIYASTMDRRDAKEEYYFPNAFFETIVREMSGSFVFFHVLSRGKVVSTELVLQSATRMYSYLGGTLAEAFEHRPNDLLKHEANVWGMGAGKKAFVLGGGYGEADGIFRYKLSFAPGGELPFRVLRRTHDADLYERLTAMRTAHAAAQGATWEPRPGFFPAYRS